MTQDKQDKNLFKNLLQNVVDVVSSSFDSMKQSWKEAREEIGVNPQATYQKPLKHQPKTKPLIFYQQPKNKPQPRLMQQSKDKIYQASPVLERAAIDIELPKKTLYITHHVNKRPPLYEPSIQASTIEYPKPLSVNYQINSRSNEKNNFSRVNGQPLLLYAPTHSK